MKYLNQMRNVGEATKNCLDEWYAAFLLGDHSEMVSMLRKMTATLPLKWQAKEKVAEAARICDFLQIFEFAKNSFKAIFVDSNDWLRYIEFHVLMGWLHENVAMKEKKWPDSARSHYKWAASAYCIAIDAVEQFMGGLIADWIKWSKILARFHTSLEGYYSRGGRRRI